MNEKLFENINHEDLKNYIKEFYNYAKEKLHLAYAPKLLLKRDVNNANDFFGKTGYYDPQNETICLFITDRHAKDIVRSFAHELIHHRQKLLGYDKNLNLNKTATDPSYALHDKGLRSMEKEAFKLGNMVFRDWTDTKKIEKKQVINEEKTKKENNMKIKINGKKKQEEMDEVKGVDDLMKKKMGPGMSDFDRSSGVRKSASSIDDIDDSEEIDLGDEEELYMDDEQGEEDVEEKPAKRSSEPVVNDQEARIANQLKARYPELYKKLSFELSPTDAYLQRKGAEDMYDEDEYGSKAGRSNPMRGPKTALPEEQLPEQQLQETNKNPYPTLFESRQRLLDEAFKTKEERIYSELVKRFIKK